MRSRVEDVRELLFSSDAGAFGLRWRLWSARRSTATATQDLPAFVGRHAKVVGVARAIDGADHVRAPFTQRPSLAWRTKLEATRRNDDGVDDRAAVRGTPQPDDDPFRYRDLPVTFEWRTWLRESFPTALAVDDETGTVTIDARYAVVAMPYERVDEHAHVNDESDALRAYLAKHGVATTMYMGTTGDHRFHEAILRAGDRVAVWGRVVESTCATDGSSRPRDARAGHRRHAGGSLRLHLADAST